MRLKNPEIEKVIGKRIRDLRKHQNLSLRFVAEKLGISYQQIQNYESGKNRVSSSRLIIFSKIFNMPMEHFVGDIGEIVESRS